MPEIFIIFIIFIIELKFPENNVMDGTADWYKLFLFTRNTNKRKKKGKSLDDKPGLLKEQSLVNNEHSLVISF